MKSSYSLDTHALIWYFTANSSLSGRAKGIVDAIFSSKKICFLSSIVLLETFHISLRKKSFSFPEFIKRINLPNIFVVPLDKKVLTACYHLPSYFDIHDRIIASTAKITNSILVTRDREIRQSKVIETIW
ncbi:hypothetical protein A2773_01310 [Candidatus Gottesmanbacteria bacterium RIFCSPHIGHO2_01_FULL_39_10]|uniref:PIN domain-containing protein n=1 Tax=Candidatus Gottesmanbacteria bacterium RIFCSPHIGHO2_01_FULL_39_10 TaxID=1798375 RepID=A0A1F5ZR03_9BACT|nr:MAG: hypothetical protein A2773_01310 [Candidatus Gottesmanbacteria bacterium RIFCSPHIGHO2_01_FULL_39_10]